MNLLLSAPAFDPSFQKVTSDLSASGRKQDANCLFIEFSLFGGAALLDASRVRRRDCFKCLLNGRSGYQRLYGFLYRFVARVFLECVCVP